MFITNVFRQPATVHLVKREQSERRALPFHGASRRRPPPTGGSSRPTRRLDSCHDGHSVLRSASSPRSSRWPGSGRSTAFAARPVPITQIRRPCSRARAPISPTSTSSPRRATTRTSSLRSTRTRSSRPGWADRRTSIPGVMYQFQIDNTGDHVEDLVIQFSASAPQNGSQTITLYGPGKPNQTGTSSTWIAQDRHVQVQRQERERQRHESLCGTARRPVLLRPRAVLQDRARSQLRQPRRRQERSGRIGEQLPRFRARQRLRHERRRKISLPPTSSTCSRW